MKLFTKKNVDARLCDYVREKLKAYTTFYGMFSFMEGVLYTLEFVWNDKDYAKKTKKWKS